MTGRLSRGLAFGAAVAALAAHSALAQEELYVTNGDAVTVFARTADGNVDPVRHLEGASTGLSATRGLALDTAHGEILVANTGNNSITVYARTAGGNMAPLRTLIGASTGLSSPFGLALDLVNDELAVVNLLGGSVTVYARTAAGDTAPLRTIAGASTGLNFPTGLALDPVHGELVVSNVGNDSVRVFSRAASGDAAPLRIVAGAATGLRAPQGLAIDTVNDELVAVNSSNSAAGNSVTVYARTADGNAAPLRTIKGAATGLCGPEGVVVDTRNDEVSVANPNDECGTSVTVYSRTASGNAAPLRTVAGAATGLTVPSFPVVATDFQVAAINPTSGPAAGGTPVVITGSVFPPGALASIGGAPAPGVVVSPTEIDATTPGLPAGTLNAVAVSSAAALPALAPGPSAAVLPAGWMADFLDVPQADIVHAYVETVFRRGITAGCGAGNYCRNDPVKRKQMAVFLLKAKLGATHVPPLATGTVFDDVPASDVFAPWIEELASLAITGGCGGNSFCPESPVRRDQMAVFLLKAFEGSAYTPPACAGIFTDVACTPTPDFAVDWIEELANRAVTGGCVTSPPQYCPLSSVLRGQMAVFLVKAFGF